MSSNNIRMSELNIYVPENYIIPDDRREREIKLRHYFSILASAINERERGIYVEEETITGGRFIPIYSPNTDESRMPRDIFRKVVPISQALPNNGSITQAHNISLGISYVPIKIYGTAVNPTSGSISWIPLPYSSPTLNENIELSIDATNVTIRTANDRRAYTKSFVIIEYVRTS